MGLTHAARSPARHGRRPRTRHPRRHRGRRPAHPGRHRLPGDRSDGPRPTTAPPPRSRHRPLSANQKEVNTAHARQRGPGERANAEIKNWRILRKIRSSPSRAITLVKVIQTLILAG
ncbi:transposase family protein [Pseudonocardia sp. H11422]|uniref:transposase family protein n=1 Tax=Pseudonocardia sp. H11422 TaxID=2835866 RepID=UPI0039773FF5